MGPDNIESRCPYCKSEQIQLIMADPPHYKCRDCHKKIGLGGYEKLYEWGMTMGVAKLIRDYENQFSPGRVKISQALRDSEQTG